jgi:cephalosporin hydroxylase
MLNKELNFSEAFNYINDELFINQMKQELNYLHIFIRGYLPKVNTILEIGIRNGGNICLLSRFLNDNGLIIGIDPEEIVTIDIELVSSIINPAIFKFIKGRSQDYVVFDKVIRELADRKADILFIDGEHTYKAVKSDYEMYSPLVNHPGIIVFHDIGGFDTDNEDWPSFYWFKEIRKHKPYIEIVSNPPLCGLGILPV